MDFPTFLLKQMSMMSSVPSLPFKPLNQPCQFAWAQTAGQPVVPTRLESEEIVSLFLELLISYSPMTVVNH